MIVYRRHAPESQLLARLPVWNDCCQHIQPELKALYKISISIHNGSASWDHTHMKLLGKGFYCKSIKN